MPITSFRPNTFSPESQKNIETTEKTRIKTKAEDDITEYVAFLKTLQILLQSNQSISDVVDMLYEDSFGDFKTAMQPIAQEVKGGKNLADAFANSTFFSPDFVKIFAVGTRSGSLDSAMESYILYVEKTMGMRRMLQSAMTYPTVMISFIVCAVIFIVSFVIPLFKELVANITIGMNSVELNLPTEILFSLHSLIEPLGKIFPILVMLLFIVYMFRKGKTKMAAFFERNIPKLRKVKNELDWGQWLSLGGIAIRAGMNPPAMLEMLKDGHLPQEIKSRYEDIIFAVNGGSGLSEELKKLKVPNKVSTMLSAAEKTGSIDRTLKDLAEIMLGGVDYKIKNVAEILNPVITIVAVVFVGVIAGSLLSVMATINTLAMQM